MSENANKGKKGFVGLSDLAFTPSKQQQTSPTKASSIAPAPPTKTSTTATNAPSGAAKSPPPTTSKPAAAVPPSLQATKPQQDRKTRGSFWPCLLVVILALGCIKLVNTCNRSPSRTSRQATAPTYTSQSSTSNAPAQLEYVKPPVGTNHILSLSQIQWCIREEIRLDAITDIIDADSSRAISNFNSEVDDYNSRCGSYRYRSNTHSQAVKNVEIYRSEIENQAIDKARQYAAPNSINQISQIQMTRAVQQLLTDFGYTPGPIDGDYGSKTKKAILEFQRDNGLLEDGQVSFQLLEILRHTK